MKKYLLVIAFLLVSSKIFSACSSGMSEIIINIIPDNFPAEISWNLTDSVGNIIASGGSVGDTVCVASGGCNLFTILDTYGDGILNPGGYWLYLNGSLIGSGGNYSFSEQHSINCPAGSFCTIPLTLVAGTSTATFDNTWYTYSAAVSGTYSISTCGLNSCNTKIWVYTTCPTIPYNEGVQGTYAYNDDNNCGTQADINVVLIAGNSYLIRIGDNNDSCSSPINFTFSYVGPIQGCTDVLACNYDPMATIDNGSCIYSPNPNCAGPDLQIDSAIFVQSLSLQAKTAGSCDVTEGCVTGYGQRYVISFTSRINNIGTLDFYIGNQSTQPGMFNLNNCHGHAHYEGYGDYRLFDSNGNIVPAGHKNGYCVIDLCGHGQYVCSNMGISAGCYDAYGVGTQCQWIDITDVPTGDYRIAVIINSKHLPDALGRYETNYVNNALQVCMHIVHNTTGSPSYTLLPTCIPYVDCNGLPGGASELDCNGLCDGPGVYGDIFQNSVLDSQDVYTYMDIIQSSMPATNCNDLNRDGMLSVYDAALVNWCRRDNPLHPAGSTHNLCNFPRNIINPNDLVGFAIKAVDLTNNFVDVEILNPLAKVKAYQFTMSGITISNVVSLASPVNFPVDVRFNSTSNEVFAISLEDSSIERSNIPQQLVRIYFSAVTDSQICISHITDVVNQNAERTTTNIYGGCFASPVNSVQAVNQKTGFVVFPNPSGDKTFVHLFEGAANIEELNIMDVTGKIYSAPHLKINDNWYELDLKKLPAGVYIVAIKNESGYSVTRLIKL